MNTLVKKLLTKKFLQDTKEGEKDLYRLARQRDRAGKDVLQVRVIKEGCAAGADERGECVEKVDGVL